MSTAFNNNHNRNLSGREKAGLVANKIVKDVIPSIVIVAILGFLLVCASLLLGAALITHSIGGWSGETEARAKQACIDAMSQELTAAGEGPELYYAGSRETNTGETSTGETDSSNTLKPQDFQLEKLKDLYGTDGAIQVSADAPFYNSARVTDLRGAKVPVRIDKTAPDKTVPPRTMTCVVNMVAADDLETPLDPTVNVHIDLH